MLSLILTCASLSLAVASLLLPRMCLKFVLELRLVFVWLSLLLWSASIVVLDLPARCVIVSRPFRPAFPFRCALRDQRLRSARLVSSCVARSAFPSRPLRRPFTTRVFASSVPFSVALRAARPSFPPRPLRFPFRCASSTQSSSPGCLCSCLVSRCFQALYRRTL